MLHEYMHLLHYPYVESTRQWLTEYLREARDHARLPSGEEIEVPVFLREEEMGNMPGQKQTLYQRSEGPASA
jgi:hypothetical protein